MHFFHYFFSINICICFQVILYNTFYLLIDGISINCKSFNFETHIVYIVTRILRVLQAIPGPLPVIYSIKIVQAEQK
jgi:hypothetical protein